MISDTHTQTHTHIYIDIYTHIYTYICQTRYGSEQKIDGRNILWATKVLQSFSSYCPLSLPRHTSLSHTPYPPPPQIPQCPPSCFSCSWCSLTFSLDISQRFRRGTASHTLGTAALLQPSNLIWRLSCVRFTMSS